MRELSLEEPHWRCFYPFVSWLDWIQRRTGGGLDGHHMISLYNTNWYIGYITDLTDPKLVWMSKPVETDRPQLVVFSNESWFLRPPRSQSDMHRVILSRRLLLVRHVQFKLK